jgi:hypothetical protein
MPSVPCDIHGTGVRNYAKGIDQEEWPRAAAAIDLSRIRPVTLTAPTLLAQADLYHSVNPVIANASGDSGGVKVARATTPDGKDPGVTGAGPAPSATPQQGEEKEVRKAEAVRPMDLPTGVPVLSLPAPKPAEF